MSTPWGLFVLNRSTIPAFCSFERLSTVYSPGHGQGGTLACLTIQTEFGAFNAETVSRLA